MNKLALLIPLFAASIGHLRAEAPDRAERVEPAAEESGAAAKDIYPRWTVVGEWRVTHPLWTDVLTLKPDGTMVTASMETTGRWTLTADGGTPLLVLRWDAYGTESALMVGPNHFRGQINPGQFMDMRRDESPDESRKTHATPNAPSASSRRPPGFLGIPRINIPRPF